MATTTDDLVVRVSVDSSGAVKGFKLVGDSTKAVGASMAATEKLADQLEKQFGMLASSSTKAAKQFDSTSKSFKLVTSSIREVSSVFIAQIRANGQLANGFKGTDQWATKAAQSFRTLASAGLTAADAAAKIGSRFTNLRQVSATAAFPTGPKLANPIKPGAEDFAQRSASAVRNVKVTDIVPPDAPKKLSLFESGLKGISASAIIMNQALELAKKAFHAIAIVVGDTVGAFIERDRAEKLLINTMKRTGGQSTTATRDLLAYADAVQETTTVSRDMALQLLATAKSAGFTDDVSKDLVMTAANLSTSWGDVETNFRALTGSFKGEAGELAQFNPKLKDLSEGALRAGGALKVLSGSFKGAAAADAKTLGGSIAQLKNEFNSLLADLGKGIVEVFHVPDGIAAIRDGIKSLRAGVNDLRADFIAFDAVMGNIGWGAFIDSMIASNATVAGLAAAWKLIDMGAVSGFFKGLVQPILYADAAVEFFLRNFTKIDVITKTVLAAARASALGYLQVVQTTFAGVLKQIETVLSAVAGTRFDIGGIAESALTKVRGALEGQRKAISDLNAEIKDSGKDLKTASAGFDFENIVSMFGLVKAKFMEAKEDAKKLQIENDKVKAPPNDSWKRLAETLRQITLETKLAANELEGIGKGQVKQIQVALQGELLNIAAKRQELQVQGLLSGAINDQLLAQEKIAKDKAAATIAAAQFEQLKESANETLALGDEIKAQTLGQVGLIEQQAQIEQRVLALKELQLDKDGLLTDGVKAQIAEQRRLIGLKEKGATAAAKSTVTADQKEQITSGFGEAAGKAAGVIGSAIGGLSGPIGAMMQVADMMVGFVQQLIDFIPKIINAVANIFSSLADLPKMITKAIANLFKSFGKLISDFIPNIIQMIPDIIGNVLDAIIGKFPILISALFSKLPDMIINMFEQFPKIIENAFSGENGAKLGTGMVISLIKGVPKITIALTKQIPMIVMAFVNGIKQAIQDIFDSIGMLFGKGPQIDTKGIEKVVDDIGKQATGVADNVFKVLDLAANAKGMDLSDKIRDAIDSASGRAMNVFQRIGAFLKKLWDEIGLALKTIWNGLLGALQALWDGLTEVWRTTWDNITTALRDVFGILKAAWDFVYDKILTPLVEGLGHAFQVFFDIVASLATKVSEAFQWVIDNVITPILSAGKDAFQWVKDNIIDKLTVENMTAAFQWVYDNIIKPLSPVGPDSIGAKAFDWVKTNVIDKLNLGGESSLGCVSFKWVKENIIDKLSPTGEGSLGQKSFQWTMDKIITPLLTIGEKGFTWVKTNIVDACVGLGEKAFTWVKTNIVDKLVGIGQQAFAWVKINIVDTLTNIGQTAFSWVKTNIVDKLTGIGQQAFDWVKINIVDKLSGIGQTAFDWVKTNIVDKLSGIGMSGFTWVKTNIVDALSGIGQTAFTWVKTNVIDKLTSFSWPKIAMPTLPTFSWPTTPTISFSWPTLPNLKSKGEDIVTGFTDGFTRNRDWIKSFGGSIVDGFSAGLSGLWDWLNNFFKTIFKNAFGAIGGGSSGGTNGGLLGSLTGGVLATGGIVTPRYAAGGDIVTFRPRGSDTQPYMLTPGEGIVNAPAVQRLGTGFIDALNSGATPRAGDTNVTFHASLTIENKGDLNEDFVKRKLMPMFIKEVQFQSLHGRPLIDLKGIRK